MQVPPLTRKSAVAEMEVILVVSLKLNVKACGSEDRPTVALLKRRYSCGREMLPARG